MRFALALALLTACAPRALVVTQDHPAHRDAPTGRLAGPPAALRPGVVTIEKPAPAKAQPATTPPTGHEGH